MHRLIFVAVVLSATAAPAQQIRRAEPGHLPPAATIDQLAWLAGSWVGQGMGGPITETYSAPLGGRITGHFVLGDGKGGVVFSELVDYVPHGGSIAYRVRHFDPDLRGWEDKGGKPVIFPLVAIERNRWFFDGLTIERSGADAITIWVMIDDEGKGQETPFRLTRMK